MTTITTNDTAARLDRLARVVRDLLAEARRQGATAAEAAASSEAGLEINVRLGEVETVEHTRDNGLGITVYFGQRKGSASTSDLSPEAVRDAVTAACAIASRTQEDPHAGLADAELMAQDLPELDLHHPWDLEPDAAIELAIACEDAARGFDPRIVNSEGASISTHTGLHVYGNSHGFVAGYPGTRQGLSCAVVAQEGENMQRDYWWTTARAAAGKVHSDMEKGFVRAETCSFADYEAAGSLHDAHKANKVRLEGRDYRVHDGDILQIRFTH